MQRLNERLLFLDVAADFLSPVPEVMGVTNLLLFPLTLKRSLETLYAICKNTIFHVVTTTRKTCSDPRGSCRRGWAPCSLWRASPGKCNVINGTPFHLSSDEVQSFFVYS